MVKTKDVKIVKKVSKKTPNWVNIEVSLNGKKFSFGLSDGLCKETVIIHHNTEFTEISFADGENWKIEKTDSNGHIYDIRRKDYKF